MCAVVLGGVQMPGDASLRVPITETMRAIGFVSKIFIVNQEILYDIHAGLKIHRCGLSEYKTEPLSFKCNVDI